MTTQLRDASQVNVVVVGGGIGGLGMARALRRAGLTVRVLEQAPEFGEVGAGLQIAANGSRILRLWGSPRRGRQPRRPANKPGMRDALDGSVLTTLDLADAEERYGAPYVVIHRSDLHGALLRACQRDGVDLVTHCAVTDVVQDPTGATAVSANRKDRGEVVIAADGLHSTLRAKLSNDQPVSSSYVAYRGAVPTDQVADLGISMKDVVVYIGERCHFVQYPLRGGEMFNQVAVFESPKTGTASQVSSPLPANIP
jgi:3-hydroxybenzoate 6-monooxygenase